MRHLRQINLNQLRIFEVVYRTGRMSTAAQELHLTQPGVSQHIKALESSLHLQLFDRVQHSLVPTPAGRELFEECTRTLNSMESLLSRLATKNQNLTGTLYLGMPINFGNNQVLPLLAEFSKKYPQVEYRLEYDFAPAMNRGLLSGQLDFAFVDEYGLDPKIEKKPIFAESLELCMSESLLPTETRNPRFNQDFFESMFYIEHEESSEITRRWFVHHLGLTRMRLNVRAVVMNFEAVTRMILKGMGIGILPGYVVDSILESGTTLHVFSGCGRPLRNNIGLAKLKGRSHSAAALALEEFLLENI